MHHNVAQIMFFVSEFRHCKNKKETTFMSQLKLVLKIFQLSGGTNQYVLTILIKSYISLASSDAVV